MATKKIETIKVGVMGRPAVDYITETQKTAEEVFQELNVETVSIQASKDGKKWIEITKETVINGFKFLLATPAVSGGALPSFSSLSCSQYQEYMLDPIKFEQKKAEIEAKRIEKERKAKEAVEEEYKKYKIGEICLLSKKCYISRHTYLKNTPVIILSKNEIEKNIQVRFLTENIETTLSPKDIKKEKRIIHIGRVLFPKKEILSLNSNITIVEQITQIKKWRDVKKIETEGGDIIIVTNPLRLRNIKIGSYKITMRFNLERMTLEEIKRVEGNIQDGDYNYLIHPFCVVVTNRDSGEKDICYGGNKMMFQDFLQKKDLLNYLQNLLSMLQTEGGMPHIPFEKFFDVLKGVQ